MTASGDSKIGTPGQDRAKTSSPKIRTQDDICPRNEVSQGENVISQNQDKHVISQNQGESVISQSGVKVTQALRSRQTVR